MKTTKEKVLDKIRENKEKIKNFGVNKIGLFGSFVKGKESKKSDVDFLVEFNSLSFDNYMGTLILLEKIFKRKVDLVIESNLRPELNYVKKEAEYVRI